MEEASHREGSVGRSINLVAGRVTPNVDAPVVAHREGAHALGQLVIDPKVNVTFDHVHTVDAQVVPQELGNVNRVSLLISFDLDPLTVDIDCQCAAGARQDVDHRIVLICEVEPRCVVYSDHSVIVEASDVRVAVAAPFVLRVNQVHICGQRIDNRLMTRISVR